MQVSEMVVFFIFFIREKNSRKAHSINRTKTNEKKVKRKRKKVTITTIITTINANGNNKNRIQWFQIVLCLPVIFELLIS